MYPRGKVASEICRTNFAVRLNALTNDFFQCVTLRDRSIYLERRFAVEEFARREEPARIATQPDQALLAIFFGDQRLQRESSSLPSRVMSCAAPIAEMLPVDADPTRPHAVGLEPFFRLFGNSPLRPSCARLLPSLDGSASG